MVGWQPAASSSKARTEHVGGMHMASWDAVVMEICKTL